MSEEGPRRRPPRSVYIRRRILVGLSAGVILIAAGALTTWIVAALRPERPTTVATVVRHDTTSTTSTSTTTTTVEVPAPPVEPDREQGEEGSSSVTSLVRIQALGGQGMSPKSVVASSKGVLFAQNMMYNHTISVFDAGGALLRTIADSVELGSFGIEGHPGVSKGAPVEMAFSPDGRTAWVSNYSMYGAGFGPEGSDKCNPGDGTSTSYLYRVDTTSFEIEAVIAVGAVPKYVAVTPDGSKVLVSNWCTWDLSVIDAETNEELVRKPLGGRYPRGIAVSADSGTAYVAMMGSDSIVSVDLGSYAVMPFTGTGGGPRHIVVSPDDEYLYVSNNRSGTVSKVGRRSGRVHATVSTGSQPRSLAISTDGEAIYVVNYGSDTVTKIRTSDMAGMQTLPTDHHPIGITYEPILRRVWVANYGGRILVYDDSRTAS